MLKRAALSLAAALAIAAPASAATVTPVGVTASNTFPFWNDYEPEYLIDGSGLSGDLHGSALGTMWMTDLSTDAATLVFHLGGVFELQALRVWNYNFGAEEMFTTLDRGAKAFTLALSMDGVTFAPAISGSFSRGTGQPLAAETFALSGVARYVQLNLSGNHQRFPETYGYAPIGLSEVRFEGTAVPEPATWAIMIAGFGLAGAALRRRRAPAVA